MRASLQRCLTGLNTAGLEAWGRLIDSARGAPAYKSACLSGQHPTPPPIKPMRQEDGKKVGGARRKASNSCSLTNEHRDRQRGVNISRGQLSTCRITKSLLSGLSKTCLPECLFITQKINKCFEEQPI